MWSRNGSRLSCRSRRGVPPFNAKYCVVILCTMVASLCSILLKGTATLTVYSTCSKVASAERKTKERRLDFMA